MQLFPVFFGYIVDVPAQRFRKEPRKKGEPAEYITFASPKGRKMYKEFIALSKHALTETARLQKK
jgi:hypothetical protein